MFSPPDWKLPPGVSRGLWDYIHDREVGRTYDGSLAHSSLFVAEEAGGRLAFPGWFGWLRAYGYLVAAQRP